MSYKNQTSTVILFDLDGVLLQSGGYISAMNATIKYLCDRMGLNDLAPDIAVHHSFESQGISSEWDMTAICLAIVFEKLSEEYGIDYLPRSIQEILNGNLQHAKKISGIDYQSVVDHLRIHLVPGKPPAESLLISEIQTKSSNFFPNLSKTDLFLELMENSQDLENNLVTRLIENHVIGDSLYEAIFQTQPLVKTMPFLKMFDRVILSNDHRDRLLNFQKKAKSKSCIFTARPSIPPKSCLAKGIHYCPEAEMGIELVGLESLPFIGFGNLQSWAYQNGQSPFSFLKPHPLQALTAIFTAFDTNECNAIDLAYGLLNNGNSTQVEQTVRSLLPAEITLSVFEDIVNGLEATKKATEILNKIGLNVQTSYFGIANDPSKAKSLQRFGAKVFDSINSALDYFTS